MIEETIGHAASILSKGTFKYDIAGFVDKETWLYLYGPVKSTEVTRFKYDTDSRGNWIKRTGSATTSINGKTEKGEGTTTYRLIEYYESSSDSRSEAPAVWGRATAGIDPKPCEPPTIRKSGGAFQQSATKKVQPSYPQVARDNRISGKVVVELTIDETGKVVSLRSIEGAPELRPATEEAAKRWEFRPTYLSKVPVRTIGTITFNFTL